MMTPKCGASAAVRSAASAQTTRPRSVLGLEALEVSAVTHADARCLWACVAYTDLANLIGSGAAVSAAVTGQSRP